jgi:DMSO/TMAO reductase YedYZ molybdopterin-dependent catalytic subunit
MKKLLDKGVPTMKLGVGCFRKKKSSIAIFISFLLVLAVSFGCIFTSSAQAEEFAKPEQIILTWTADPTSSQTITWLTSNNSPAQVQYIMANEFNGNFDSAQEADVNGTTFGSVYYRYTVNLNGLTPDTKYIYRVGNEGAWSDTLSFTTAADTDNFSFLYMGDVQSGYAEWGNMVDTVYQDYPQLKFSLLGGDLTDNSADENEWGQFLDAVAGVFSRIQMMPTMGNHDGAMYSNFFALPDNGPIGLTQEFYSFDYGNAHFVVLNSNKNTDQVAKQWLQEDLQNTDKTWKFAVFHHPAYPAFDDYKTIDDSIRANWIPILEQNKVDMVFMGHQHVYMRTHPIYQGEVQTDPAAYGIIYVMGNSGSKTYAGGEGFPYIAREETGSNYQVIDINGDVLTLTAKKANGELIESYTIHKTPVQPETPTTDVLYEGTVALTPDETFTVTAYTSSLDYTVNRNTPLGALQAAATAGGFTYGVTDKKYAESGILLLDNVGTYTRKNPGYWYAYVNDVHKDGYDNTADALNLIELVDGDRVEFYYAAGIDDATNLNAVKAVATAAVKTVVATGVTPTEPTDWTLQLSGAKNTKITKADFENGLACSASHRVSWTDDDGNVWGGMPLWLLVAVVDDDPDIGDKHFNFNDELAAQKYQVDVIAGDGWKATFDSTEIAHNNGFIVANTLNGEPLLQKLDSGKGSWPLHLKGSAVFSGRQVGNIVKIELSNLPEPPVGWNLEMIGEVGDIITQEEFEDGLACTGSGHYKEWKDKDGNAWSGVPLWVLLGAVDDIESSSHWTFNDTVAAGYTVKVSAADYSKTFNGADVTRSDDYIIANKFNGQPLTDSGPLRLVGAGVAKDDGSLGGAAVGSITKIEIPELQTSAAADGSWNLTLTGKISDVFSQAEFEDALTCHSAEWTDGEKNVWSGIPLWYLTGWVDDRQPHKYDANQATAGYTILVKAADGYTKDFSSKDVAWSNDYIIANKFNGEPLTDSWPLRLVGKGVAKDDGSLGGTSVGNIAEIELTSFGTAVPIPEVHIVKYGEDHTTILQEKTVDYLWMESKLDVIGDGKTVYKFEGITNNPDDVWDADEKYPGGYKIANAVKGTRIKDLCELVGGMGAGTEIVLAAKDGYKTILPYSSIYTDPLVQARQGDAILAWWADGEYVPDYRDGMRLFFTPDGDNVYGQWDMHETLPENYWHYYYGDGVQYPSCAGLSTKHITEIKVYSVPQGDWTLELDGQGIDGLHYDVSKTYFESALACQFGANHKAIYTDSKQRVWEGMPLWLLVGFVDDADQHSNNAFNHELAIAGYQVVITAADGHAIAIDSADIDRNNDYIIANSLDGALIPESDSNWPLRLVGPKVSGKDSISQIVSIELVKSVPVQPGTAQYKVTPEPDAVYNIEATEDGIQTMTVNTGQNGFKYFQASIEPINANEGKETTVFTHLRGDIQLGICASVADFDVVNTAKAGFNVQTGDVVKVYIVDQLINDANQNPIVLQ